MLGFVFIEVIFKALLLALLYRWKNYCVYIKAADETRRHIIIIITIIVIITIIIIIITIIVIIILFLLLVDSFDLATISQGQVRSG